MALISKSIPNLINGVSQQPDEVRLPSQCAEQDNFMSSVVEGLKRREGTRHLADLLVTDDASVKVVVINRDRFEKYVALIYGGDIRVFDFQGNEKTVNKPNGTNYLVAPSSSQDIGASTVADYTFLVNKTIPVRLGDAEVPSGGGAGSPITESYQIITVGNIPTRGGNSCFNRYGISISGLTIQEWANRYTANSFAALVASRLTSRLNRRVTANGNRIEIPLPGTTPLAFSDMSERRRIIGRGIGCGFRSSGLGDRFDNLSSTVVTRVIGYVPPTSAAGGEPLKEGLFHVRQGDYSTTYKVFIDGTERASYTTGDSNREQLRTTNIAQNLLSSLQGHNLADMSFFRVGSTVICRATKAGKDFSLRTEDSMSNRALIACKDRVQSFTDLPQVCTPGFTIKVAGQDGISADDYYLRYTEEVGGAQSTGVWMEAAKPGLTTAPDRATMPHALVSNADGTFTFKRIDWNPRVAGDEDTAPDPSFIGRPLNDVFFFKNRLGFLSDENVVFSSAGDFFNFYPQTVQALLDGDPIDVAVTSENISILRHAVPFNENLILFSDQTQFVLRGGETLTKSSVSIDITTRFDATLKAKPVGVGKNIYFATRRGSYTNLREYYVDPDSQVNDAANVNSHCPEYLPGETLSIAGSSTEDTVVVQTEGDPESLYVYKFYWQGNEKVQSSWSRWNFGALVLGMEFIESQLFLVVLRNGKISLESLDVGPIPESVDSRFERTIHLDSFRLVNEGETLPTTADGLMAVDVKGNSFTGERLAVVVEDGVATRDLVIGFPFTSSYKFSKFILMDSESRTAWLKGRLMLRFVSLKFLETSGFTLNVDATGRQRRSLEFAGRYVGADTNTVGFQPIVEGIKRFPVMGEASTITVSIDSNSHLPCTFLAAEWEAQYHRQSQRV